MIVSLVHHGKLAEQDCAASLRATQPGHLFSGIKVMIQCWFNSLRKSAPNVTR